MIASRKLCYQHAPGAPMLAFPDVDVPPGGVLLISGAANAGKSTWLALAAGLLVPAAGELQVALVAPASLPVAERNAWRTSTVGVLPRCVPLNLALTVQGNLALAYFALGQREDRHAISRALAAVQMDSLATRPARELTPLQARRVALARAMLLAPQVLLLDEPAAGLPPDDLPLLASWAQLWAADKRSTLVIAVRDAAPWRKVLAQAQTMELLAPQHAAA